MKGASRTVHQVMKSFWSGAPADMVEDEGMREAIDLELRKGLAEFNWQPTESDSGRFISWFARVTAALTLISGVLKFERSCKLDGNLPLFAVHREWSNRTRHVWQQLSGRDAIVFLLGRPFLRPCISKLKRLLSQHGIDVEGIRFVAPYERGRLITRLSLGWREANTFLAVLREFIAQCGFSPDTRQTAGMIYRIMLGTAHAQWIKSQSSAESRCVFGHTGLGDSGRIDHALRAKGVETVHWFHGVSAGQNFYGYSSIALCKSGFDRTLTMRLGGYQRATYSPACVPELAEPRNGWLLLTNWLHPQNPSFRKHGPRDELLLLDQIARAGERAGLDARDVVWKPHPAFQSLSETVQNEVLSRLRVYGFSQWDKNNNIKYFRIILCTVSTTIIDVLLSGQVPVIHTLQEFDQDSFVGVLPQALFVSTARDIESAARKMTDRNFRGSLFQQAWQAVLPGGAVTNPECT